MNESTKRQLAAVRQYTDMKPVVALTLGSGLGSIADMIQVECEIPYGELPEFPISTAPGHAGKLIFGYIGDLPIVCMKGRLHLYEGYSRNQVVMPVRLLHALGTKILFLTNAAGGIKETYEAGTLAMITDHITIFAPNPLIGPNDSDLGVRFLDMLQVYDKQLQEILMRTAKENDIAHDTGVYAQLTGPSFETPAEIRALKILGADLVGMSTAIEAITARHCGLRVCAVSLVSNLAAGITGQPLSSEEVDEAGKAAAPRFTKLVLAAIEAMGKEALA